MYIFYFERSEKYWFYNAVLVFYVCGHLFTFFFELKTMVYLYVIYLMYNINLNIMCLSKNISSPCCMLALLVNIWPNIEYRLAGMDHDYRDRFVERFKTPGDGIYEEFFQKENCTFLLWIIHVIYIKLIFLLCI